MHQSPRFVADVHLGRLARMLRMLGFDTLYNNVWSKADLLKTAVSEERILLSRNGTLSKNPFLQTCIIVSENAQEQLAQVATAFYLHDQFEPFSRCIACNHPVQPIAKEAVLHLLQPQTAREHQQFWLCPNCNKVYWQGSHFQRMMEQIQQLKKP